MTWPTLSEILQFQDSSTPGSFLFFDACSSSSTQAPSPPYQSPTASPAPQSPVVKTESPRSFAASSHCLKRTGSPVFVILDDSDEEATDVLSPANFPAVSEPSDIEPAVKRPRLERRNKSSKEWFNTRYGDQQKFAVCKFFATFCKEGNNCRFSHVADGPETTKQINEPCRFLYACAPYECKKGDRCVFRHDLGEIACVWREMEVPCRRGLGGKCEFKHNVGFSTGEKERMEFVKMFKNVLSERGKGGNGVVMGVRGSTVVGDEGKKFWWEEYLRREVDEVKLA
jgi:hypothetical protein